MATFVYWRQSGAPWYLKSHSATNFLLSSTNIYQDYKSLPLNMPQRCHRCDRIGRLARNWPGRPGALFVHLFERVTLGAGVSITVNYVS